MKFRLLIVIGILAINLLPVRKETAYLIEMDYVGPTVEYQSKAGDEEDICQSFTVVYNQEYTYRGFPMASFVDVDYSCPQDASSRVINIGSILVNSFLVVIMLVTGKIAYRKMKERKS